MADDKTKTKQAFRISRVLRYGGFAVLLLMLILSLLYPFTQPPRLTDEEAIAATVQAGVDLGLTQAAIQTGTPDATAIQATVDAGVEATLAQVAVRATQTAQPEDTDTGASPIPEGVSSWVTSLWNAVAGIVIGAWEFAGRGGIFAQVCCCILPIGAIALGIIND